MCAPPFEFFCFKVLALLYHQATLIIKWVHQVVVEWGGEGRGLGGWRNVLHVVEGVEGICAHVCTLLPHSLWLLA